MFVSSHQIIVSYKVNVKNHLFPEYKKLLISLLYEQNISMSTTEIQASTVNTVTWWLGWKMKESFISWQEKEISLFPKAKKPDQSPPSV